MRPLRRSFKTLWDNSQTKLWAYTQWLGTGLLASVSTINSYVSNDTFKSYLDQLDVPKSFMIALAIFGLITFVAHGHGDDA